MDIRERDGTEPLNFDYNVLVATYAARITLVTGKRSAGDADSVADLKLGFAIDLAALRALDRKEPEETELGVGNRLHVVAALISVDPHQRQVGIQTATFVFERAGCFDIDMHEEETRNKRALARSTGWRRHGLHRQIGLYLPEGESLDGLNRSGTTYCKPFILNHIYRASGFEKMSPVVVDEGNRAPFSVSFTPNRL